MSVKKAILIFITANFANLQEIPLKDFPYQYTPVGFYVEIKPEKVSEELYTFWVVKRRLGYLIFGFGNTNALADVFYITVDSKNYKLSLQSCELINNELERCRDDGPWKLEGFYMNHYKMNWIAKVTRKTSVVVNVPFNEENIVLFTEIGDDDERKFDHEDDELVVQELESINLKEESNQSVVRVIWVSLLAIFISLV